MSVQTAHEAMKKQRENLNKFEEKDLLAKHRKEMIKFTKFFLVSQANVRFLHSASVCILIGVSLT